MAGPYKDGYVECVAEVERLSKENALLREAHAQHKYEGWCPMCHPTEYAAAGLKPQDIA